MIYLPLVPDTKRPAVSGWADPDYEGVEPEVGGWYGLRADNLVIVDCDSQEAADAWWDGQEDRTTFRVKTPRGFHFYYRSGPGSPTGPHVGVLPGVDIRAGRGSYVVWLGAPGYDRVGDRSPAPYNPAWLTISAKAATETDGDGWETIPSGQRNATLAAFGGSLRKQGMKDTQIARVLWGVNTNYCEPPLSKEEVIQIARSVGRYEPDPDETTKVEFVDDELHPDWWNDLTMPPPPEWYWKPYLPKGRLVFLDGREGIGKGMFCTYLARCVVSGVRPDGTPDTPGNVLWLPAEDDPEEDILRRLYAAGARPDLVPGRVAFLSDDSVRLPAQEAALTQLIHDTKARLVILDPGRAFLGPDRGQDGRDFSYNNEAHVRPGMQACLRIAKNTGATIMFVHHWNKNTASEINYRASGSGAFNQVVRHRITIARVESDDGFINGAFAVTKSNIIDTGHVHGYTLEEVPALDTATFILTDPKTDHTLDAWEKRAKAGAENRKMGPGYQLENWLTEQGYRIGDPVPAREEVEKALDMSQAEAKQALATLRERGLIGQQGAGRSVVLAETSHVILAG